jgi:TonB-dependent receptor
MFSGTVGHRLAGGRVGLLAGFSASKLNRGSEDFEPAYDDGNLDDLQLRDYQITRERYGANIAADVRTGEHSTLTFRTILNKFKDYEVNNRLRYRPSSNRNEFVLKNRHQSDTVRSFSVTGAQVLPTNTAIEYRLAWARSEESQPDRLDTIFRQSGITFAPNVSADFVDPNDIQPNPSSINASIARLNAWETEIFSSVDRDITGSFDVNMPLSSGSGRATFFKFGAKVKGKSKTNDLLVQSASPSSPVLFPQLEDTTFKNDKFLSFFPAHYPSFPGIDAAASRAMFNSLPASAIEFDPESDSEDYAANETVAAGYGMLELFLGEKVVLVPGIRYERTGVHYTGNIVLFNEDGDYASTEPVTGKSTSGVVLPGLHLRYAVDESTSLRAAYSRTLARPNYYDLVPYQIVQQEDAEIQRGNSDLVPTVSDNIDLLFEHYFQTVGVVSGGVFYKHLTNYIYPFRVREQNFGELYDVTQPRNGDVATLRGVELAFQNRLRFLPAPFDGIGVYANYTFTSSTAQFPDRTEKSRLPGQSTHLGNFAVSYEKRGFLGRVSVNFNGKFISEVGEKASEDVYYDNHNQIDLNFSQRLTKNAQLYADFLNLTNAPLRYYLGSSNRPIQEEYYRPWMSYGLRLNW